MNALSGRLARSARNWLCALAAAAVPAATWAAPACVAPEGGIGGTGAPLERGGIGGTGAPQSPARGGIGGTGSPQLPGKGGIGGTGQQAEGGIGGTGIVGIITGFGSVCVDGLEVQYDAATPVSSNGLPSRSDRLALGQVIAIDAVGSGQGLVANSISILNAIEGPVTSVAADVGLLYVMRQPVRMTADTHLVGFATDDGPVTGLPVKVSGYRNAANQIVASRIEVARDLQEASVIGEVAASQADQPSISGLPVRATAATLPTGAEALVRGRWDGQRINPTQVLRDPSLPFAGHVGRIVIEGLVQHRSEAQRLRVGGFDVTYSADTSFSGGDSSNAQEGRRIRITGRLGPGRSLQADHIEVMHLSRMGTPMNQVDEMGRPMPGGPFGQMPMGSPGMMGSPAGMSPSGGSIGGGSIGGGSIGGGSIGGGSMGGGSMRR